jgi:hypothetical protein
MSPATTVVSHYEYVRVAEPGDETFYNRALLGIELCHVNRNVIGFVDGSLCP